MKRSANTVSIIQVLDLNLQGRQVNPAQPLFFLESNPQSDDSTAKGGRCLGAHPVSAIKAAEEILRLGLMAEERMDFAALPGSIIA